MDQVDAIHLEDLSQLTMDYAGRFPWRCPTARTIEQMLRSCRASVDKLETNQTGTIDLDPGRTTRSCDPGLERPAKLPKRGDGAPPLPFPEKIWGKAARALDRRAKVSYNKLNV